MKTFQFTNDDTVTGLVIEEHPAVSLVEFGNPAGQHWVPTASLTITTVTLINEPDTGIDSQVAYRQITATDRWRLVRLAARDLYYDETAGYVQLDVKPATRKLRVVIKLDTDDTYAVEIGRVKTVDYIPTYQVLEQVRGINAAELGQTVEDMAVKHSQRRR